MKKKNAKGPKVASSPVQKAPFDLAQRVSDVSGAFVESIERLVKQALQEHIRAATEGLVGRALNVPATKDAPVLTGGGPLASQDSSSKAGKKAKKAKKAKAAKSAKAPKESKPVVLSPADEELQEKLLIFLEATPGSRVEAMTEALKASPESVRRVVARLFEQKRLVRRGKTRGTKDSLAHKA